MITDDRERLEKRVLRLARTYDSTMNAVVVAWHTDDECTVLVTGSGRRSNVCASGPTSDDALVSLERRLVGLVRGQEIGRLLDGDDDEACDSAFEAGRSAGAASC